MKYGGMREDSKPLLSPDETKNSMKEALPGGELAIH
jgi:hypothetical protein